MITNLDICEELSRNFLDFAYEANSCRGFPDARDGLKPGQRACLWEMFKRGYLSNKPHVKSAKISGGVAAAWWPHGTTAIYETFARMSQDWINNVPEIDWHGMNGSQIISNEPAADRYTEARLAKVTEDGMFAGIKKNNVNMIPNFSEDDEWPEVLPAIFPRLLVNGSQGIGVTIANVWLPHPFAEAAAVLTKYMDTGEVDTTLLAPSFPSGGVIINKEDVHTIYETGRGKVILRGKTEIKGKSIFITEMPYQVYVEPYIEKVKTLIKDDTLTGIEEIYNRSDKKGIKIEIVCDIDPNQVLKQLYLKTDLQTNFNANQWALVGKTPKLLTLADYCKLYLDHNIDCVTREIKYDLEKASNRLHIVEGLLKALADIDDVIKLIKNSDSSSAAKAALMKKYSLDDVQAQAILDMRLAKLAHMEKIEVENEKKELVSKIDELQSILLSKDKKIDIVRTRLAALVKKYGDKRRTELAQIELPKQEKEIAEVIPEDCVVVVSQSGLIKRIPLKNFKTQRRNGVGVKNSDDITAFSLKTNTIDHLMVFTSAGRAYSLLVDKIPEGTNAGRGVGLYGLINFAQGETPIAYSSLHHNTLAKYVFFVTKKGIIKKVPLEEYNSKRSTGVIAIAFKEGDSLADVTFIEDENMLLVTKKGYAIQFKTTELPISSRTAQGIKGINLTSDDEVVCCIPIKHTTDSLAIFTDSGLGKSIPLSEVSCQGRAGRGLPVYKDRQVIGACLVDDSDSLLIIGDKTSIKIEAKDLTKGSRASIGSMLIKNNTKAVSVSKI